ncbi:dolichyl-phosphate-mannose-protein mannosyltransferase [Leptospira sp. 2 VSF19]|uniref:Dolichyl-phosphate-mannose-protein mannosyltransferase n=1 Tax=Leptospira soteropolitanensis TaxID=2950025 RepID=A0AAW5VE02_9LEPT|nr:dolichyl-phosphate-mannose-protein mannosyltransferase [Leptospira soteropolitanensis]MCW7493403.1 dolichyl-phosphate-mannose-protein mannosyltransferase [Leptospira soteropolitanensis]MCW7501065.1 dolichyl-phosphate-mannose-protein mannosyltransferase [Leptospira soteropolitanensis]MCW7523255.1 dolichyl-phosphate-mannose-protein mannosyltransferase [Leptospira soteropolitanensis]MCW7527116.1 dolichyl-phosphate-mannose-protein mannosyltransferase [Leptospira soteropolitanensis]MCW7530973.1 
MRKISGNTVIVTISISLLLFLIQWLIRVDSYFLSDPLVKMIQTISLWKQGWSTESIIYPAKEIDPDFLFSPFNEGFVFLNNNRFIGQYPIALTFLYSLFGFLPFSILPYFNILFLFVFLRLLTKNSIQIPTLVIVTLGTVVFPLLIDFSENGPFILLSGYGYIYLWKAYLTDQKQDWLLGNLFLGISLWFRLEGVLFFLSIQITIGLIQVFIKKEPILKKLHPVRFLVFAAILSLFLLWNTYSYSHPLGTRHLTNFGNSDKTFYDQMKIFLSMVFTYPRSNGWSFGFFLQSPIFIYAILKLRKVQITTNLNLLFHLLIVPIYLLIAGLTSPNDGITLTGRYLVVTVFPLSFILNEQMNELRKNKWILYPIYVWMFLFSFLIIAIFYFSSIELKKLRTELKTFQSPLIVTTNELISGGFGLDLIDKKVICVRRENLLDYFEKNLQRTLPKEFTILTIGKESNKNQAEKNLFTSLLVRSEKSGYNCSREERTARILGKTCIKSNE